jgi:hypothetical protein
VPISELVFGTLTQNRSSLEPSLGIAAIAGTPRIEKPTAKRVVPRLACLSRRDPEEIAQSRDVMIRPAPGLRRAFSNAYRGACQRGANCLILSVVEPTATIKKVNKTQHQD